VVKFEVGGEVDDELFNPEETAEDRLDQFNRSLQRLKNSLDRLKDAGLSDEERIKIIKGALQEVEKCLLALEG
jgi:hypothetical protein